MSAHESIVQLTPQRLALHRELFRWAVDNGVASVAFDPEGAAGWALLAAKVSNTFGNERLASRRLEQLLLQLAANIPQPPAPSARSERRRWLHVFSEIYRTGGHTALAERWIAADVANDHHSAALTFQKKVDVPSLQEATQKTGGDIVPLGNFKSLIERAARLRQLAWQNADVVVMHTHMWDIVALLAFGTPGGPPVIMVNHADHAFWLGASIADSVIHIRDSGRHVAENWRGIGRHSYLPIPLPEAAPASDSLRNQTRRELLIPPDAPVFLTVGTQFKYTPIGNLNFLVAARRILEQLPSAWVVAIGPSDDHPDWRAAHEETGGRLLALGEQYDLHRFHIAADIYLEGFPFGSLTALLEAALTGLPCVRAPRACPPPFVSDGEALNDLPQPVDLDEYISEATRLALEPDRRKQYGEAIKSAVERIHVGPGWQTYLAQLKATLPTEHRLHALDAPIADPLWEQYWAPFLAQRTGFDPLLYAFVTAKQHGLTPRMDWKLLAAALRYRSHTRPSGMPGPLSLWLFGSLLDPVAAKLKYRRTAERPAWWPWLAARYWLDRLMGRDGRAGIKGQQA